MGSNGKPKAGQDLGSHGECAIHKNVVRKKSRVRAVSVSGSVSVDQPMCRGPDRVRTDFSGMPLGKAKFVAHPPYWQEAVKLELCALRVKHMEATAIDLRVAVCTTVVLVDKNTCSWQIKCTERRQYSYGIPAPLYCGRPSSKG
jgi:hypothetical protein